MDNLWITVSIAHENPNPKKDLQQQLREARAVLWTARSGKLDRDNNAA